MWSIKFGIGIFDQQVGEREEVADHLLDIWQTEDGTSAEARTLLKLSLDSFESPNDSRPKTFFSFTVPTAKELDVEFFCLSLKPLRMPR